MRCSNLSERLAPTPAPGFEKDVKLPGRTAVRWYCKRAPAPLAPTSHDVQPSLLAAALIARADAARDARRYRDAATLYNEALLIEPDNAGIQIQCGHMFKEAGELTAAEEHYRHADLLSPGDADLALQLGHFYKVAGRVREAQAAYKRAIALKAGWDEPAAELAELQRRGVRDRGAAAFPPGHRLASTDRTLRRFDTEAEELSRAASTGRLVPEIVPRPPSELLYPFQESINLRRFGKRERSHWGMTTTFRGVEAVRGFCISASPATELQITLNGLGIHRGPLRGGYSLQYERDNPNLLKYVFNVWIDFTHYTYGKYEIELRFSFLSRDTQIHREQVVIAEPLSEDDYPGSDGIISLPEADNRSAEEQIRARPSMVRPAGRSVLPAAPRNVLLLRTDQLGDMVTSIPAMRRLRELLPHSHLVGLLTSANAELAATLGLFDEIIIVDFPDDLFQRRRTMPLDVQQALRDRLLAYKFDLAVDLSESGMSRPLLLLSGAPFLYGFYDRDWPWLSAGFEGNTRDRKNDREVAAHSTRVLAFVERLGALLTSRAEVIRRPDLTRERLATEYGIAKHERFAVVHTGARITFSRWPNFPELASELISRTDLKIVMMTDDKTLRSKLPESLIGSDRFLFLDGWLPFDDFDALLSYCTVFVGNDSGPKHLAALRGVGVVSIHSARINWSEWGQELSGSIITRRVPCAGCAIYHDGDECGQDHSCIKLIKTAEVFDAVMNVIKQ